MNVSPQPLRHSGPRAGVSAAFRIGSAGGIATEIPGQARNDPVNQSKPIPTPSVTPDLIRGLRLWITGIPLRIGMDAGSSPA